jgi:HK97 family phage major capsid protein
MSFNSKAAEAFDARQHAVAELRTLSEEAATRDFTAEEQAKADKLNDAIDAHEAEARHDLAEAQRDEATAELRAMIGEPAPVVEAEVIPAEVRALAEGAPSVTFEARDLVVGTDADGGHAVKTTLAQAIYEDLTADQDTLIGAVDLKVTPTGEPMEEVVTNGRSAAALVAENGAIGESNPSFSTVTLGAYKLGFHIPVSAELEQDAYAAIMPFVAKQATEAIRDGFGNLLVNGTGVSQPQGILAAGSTPTTTAAIGGPSYADLVNVYHSILPAGRGNASWIFNDDTVRQLRLLVDADGRSIWQPSLVAGTPDTIMGRPVLQDAGIPTTGANNVIGAFGDFKRGVVARMAGGIRADRSAEFAFLNDKVVYRFVVRVDSKVRDAAAFTLIDNPAS